MSIERLDHRPTSAAPVADGGAGSDRRISPLVEMRDIRVVVRRRPRRRRRDGRPPAGRGRRPRRRQRRRQDDPDANVCLARTPPTRARSCIDGDR